MFVKLLILFTVIPFLELAILIKLGTLIGLVPTLAIVILTGLLGAALARSQGFATLTRIQQELQAGQLPADSLLDGAIILAGALLLVTPGILTDLTGFLCLIPATRVVFKRLLREWLRKRWQIQTHYENFDRRDSFWT